jgi:predicted metalloprotease with PDZ domain
MSAETSEQGTSLVIGKVAPLFQANPATTPGRPYDVSADGKKFVVAAQGAQERSGPLTLVVNWPALPKKQRRPEPQQRAALEANVDLAFRRRLTLAPAPGFVSNLHKPFERATKRRSWMLRSRLRLPSYLAALLLLGAASARAQTGPTIQLTVDATQAPEGILRTREVIPVNPGPLTLYYPKWIPGEHRPDGPIGNVAGLFFSAKGKRIPWVRDLQDVYTFHVTVPAGVSQLDVSFQYLELSGGGYERGVSATAELMELNWNQNLLYLAGVRAQQQSFDATLVLPEGWKFGTPLPLESQQGNRITFKPAALNRLVDSPVLAGQYYRAINLTPPGEPIHHEIDIAADKPEALDMRPEVQRGLVNLVAESGKLFGARHYRDYHFLLSLSDYAPHSGLEHHECNDSRLPLRALLKPDAAYLVGSILSHEFVHSWNGKFRRPATLSTPYYEVPEEADLLWVYEGLTDYLGHVLAARSGLWTKDQFHQYLAATAASLGPGRPGRTWRPLQDTANALPGMFAFGWTNWRRGTDYYQEGDLLWLEAATIIDRESRGKKSFDDFCKLFYGGPNDGPQLKPYTFDQLVAALNQVVPYDWAKFLRERLDSTSPDAPLGGIEASGWKVIYNAQPVREVRGRYRGLVHASYSIGLTVGSDGTVLDSIWHGPAFEAGVTPGMKIVGVNDRVFTPESLNDAINASATSTEPIRLLVANEGQFKACVIKYHGGPRYPHLVRKEGKPDYLDSTVLSARAPHQ